MAYIINLMHIISHCFCSSLWLPPAWAAASIELVGCQLFPALVSAPQWSFQDKSRGHCCALASTLESQVLLCFLFSTKEKYLWDNR